MQLLNHKLVAAHLWSLHDGVEELTRLRAFFSSVGLLFQALALRSRLIVMGVTVMQIA